MTYVVKRAATGLEVGDRLTVEELAKKGDVPNMLRKGIIEPLGFTDAGAPLTDEEAAARIAEIQKKLEDAEDERDMYRDEVKKLEREILRLKDGHAEGKRQLDAAAVELAALKKSAPDGGKAADSAKLNPVTPRA